MKCNLVLRLLLFLLVSVCWSSDHISEHELASLRAAHDQCKYTEIVEFVRASGIWSLHSAYELEHIEWQALLDMAALTGHLGCFYREFRLSSKEKTNRVQLMQAIRWAQGFRKMGLEELAFLPPDVKATASLLLS
jgi:hypothetical protein